MSPGTRGQSCRHRFIGSVEPGVLFPIFFFLAFNMGRTIPAENVIPGMVAMALWFTASAVGPLVTSCERRAKT
ncbi:MAG: hypothetical protein AMK72_00655 [Planctomycetes bacterium SM23_25]|nr:MAG: hypothetical protein AMK72_00655 [Planctomycetes bacterium SM23_25]